ncbi:MAG: tRNA (adenosine(37)-N6)-threonylcarbamoyltransferase complex ATPase subunit type 1 TsaE, partial [Candidatus Nanopelagicaceae bacterium]|nr:tRNA (adenosine(37)-N6)-threonylcarbamoyltransferase complex ATPase subunit type 1 TsaE [Candidatus Nanopelagicaceae bacterium]
VLKGDLGAGKTALASGIGMGLGIEGVSSPTFIISRVHKAKVPLIHIDAYRLLLSGAKGFEFDDLDIATSKDHAITVIEWGDSLVNRLSDEYLVIDIAFGAGENERKLSATGIGSRWAGFSL